MAASLLVLVALPQGRTSSRTVLQTTTTVAGETIVFPARADKVTALAASLKTGGQTGTFSNQVPTVIYVLSGTVTLETPGRPAKTLRTGEAAVLPSAKTTNLANKGTIPARYAMIVFGTEGTPVSAAGTEARNFKADTVLETTTTWAGEPLLYPAGANQVAVLQTSVPAGAVIARHTHAHTQFVYMLEGEHTVEPTGHAKHTFGAGSAMIETTQPHVGRNATTGADRFMTVFVGKAGVPLSTPVH